MLSELKKGWNSPQGRLRFLIISLLALTVFFRFVNLGRGVFWYDEAFTYLRASGYTEAEVVQQFAGGREIGVEDLQKYQQINSEKDVTDTVKSLASEEPQLSPLYYVTAYFWMHWFGNSLVAMRSLSALISLLAFPCIYWLCLELFESPLIGWMAVAAIAVSPFHLLFAQVSRQYSLWTVTILLSSTAVLRSIRLDKECKVSRSRVSAWCIYAATVAVGLYSHLAFGLVAIGHGIYVAIAERFRLSRTLIAYLLASLVGLLTFTPWLLVVINSPKHIYNAVGKTEAKSLLYLIEKWAINTSSIFIDINFDYVDSPAKYLLVIPVLIVEAYSLYFLYRQAPKRAWVFILLLIGITGLSLTLPDLISHTSRSVTSRYMIPCYLGIQIAVAYLLATQITHIYVNWQQKVWQLALVVLLSGGILSYVMISRAEAWWNKGFSYYYPQVARLVNQASHPLLITDTKTGRILTLSHLLEPEVQFKAQPECRTCRSKIPSHGMKNLLTIPEDRSNLFLFSPSEKLRTKLEKKYKIEPAYIKGELWRLEH